MKDLSLTYFLCCLPQLTVHVKMWFLLLLVFVTSYGVFRQALFFGNKQPSWNVIQEVLYKPYWYVYGEFFIKEGGESFFLL